MLLTPGIRLATTLSEGVGAPAWAQGSDLWLDFANNRGSALPADTVTDTHAASINALNNSGTYEAFGANVLTRTDLGLQTVPTRTNLVSPSISTPGTYASHSATTGSPIEGVTAQSVVETTDNNIHLTSVYATSIAADTVHTFSGIVKANGRDEVVFFVYAAPGYGSSLQMRVDLTDGTITSAAAAGGSASVTAGRATAIGGGWYLVELVGKVDGSSTQADFSIQGYNGGTSYAGTADLAIFDIALMQVEAGAFASPPIVTTSGTVTVAGNQQTVDLSSYADAAEAGLVSGTIVNSNDTDVLWSRNDGTANEWWGLVRDGSNLDFRVIDGGSTVADLDLGSLPSGDFAVAYVVGSNYARAEIVGGSTVTADTSVTVPTVTTMAFGGDGYSVTRNSVFRTKKVAIDSGITANAAAFAAILAKATLAEP